MSEQQADYKTLWTVTELSGAVGLTPVYIRRLVANGRIEGIKRGKTWLIPDSEAKAFISSRNKASDK